MFCCRRWRNSWHKQTHIFCLCISYGWKIIVNKDYTPFFLLKNHLKLLKDLTMRTTAVESPYHDFLLHVKKTAMHHFCLTHFSIVTICRVCSKKQLQEFLYTCFSLPPTAADGQHGRCIMSQHVFRNKCLYIYLSGDERLPVNPWSLCCFFFCCFSFVLHWHFSPVCFHCGAVSLF